MCDTAFVPVYPEASRPFVLLCLSKVQFKKITVLIAELVVHLFINYGTVRQSGNWEVKDTI